MGQRLTGETDRAEEGAGALCPRHPVKHGPRAQHGAVMCGGIRARGLPRRLLVVVLLADLETGCIFEAQRTLSGCNHCEGLEVKFGWGGGGGGGLPVKGLHQKLVDEWMGGWVNGWGTQQIKSGAG